MEAHVGDAYPDIVPIATRTLLAAGFTISGVDRQPSHIEFKCERASRLGPTVRFLIAITAQPQFSDSQMQQITHAANNQGRLPVMVSIGGTAQQLAWVDFMDILGGAVPSWKALTDEYRDRLKAASENRLPTGMSGEAWWIFESLVADGLEFCFGRRVNRLGGQKRGKRVSDMVAPLPDFRVVVVDAKATGSAFDVGAGSLRALIEYTARQKKRQQAGGDVMAALIVSSAFAQNEQGLAVAAKDFFGEAGTPLCFITADSLWGMVKALRSKPDIRICVRWNMLFSGGLVQAKQVESEIRQAALERCETREI